MSTRAKAVRLEKLLGENLVYICDQLDAAIRSGDKRAIRAARELNEAWQISTTMISNKPTSESRR